MKMWRLIDSLMDECFNTVRVNGVASRQFAIRQGVRQGGVGSTHLYKMFLNPLLRRLEKTGSGYAIQGIPLGTPTCADDVLLGIGFAGLHLLLDFCHIYSETSSYDLHPDKSTGTSGTAPRPQPNEAD